MISIPMIERRRSSSAPAPSPDSLSGGSAFTDYSGLAAYDGGSASTNYSGLSEFDGGIASTTHPD